MYDSLREVGNEAVKCVLFHLEEVSKFDRVKDLPYSSLDTIVQSNELRCSEKVVLDVICNWLLHHPEVTKDEHEHLIAQCRHVLITSQDVDILHTYKDVIGNDHALNMSTEMLKYTNDQKKRCLESNKWNTPRGIKCLVSVGGSNNSSICSSLTAITLKNEFGKKLDFKKRMSYPCTKTVVVTKGHCLFMIGGSTGVHFISNTIVNYVHCYDSVSDIWTVLSPMLTARV